VKGHNDSEPEGTSPPPTGDADSQPVHSTPGEGLEMMGAFARIRSPAIRAALIELASRLANADSN
jgi:hypothetical protein